jgi:hypothetical protein
VNGVIKYSLALLLGLSAFGCLTEQEAPDIRTTSQALTITSNHQIGFVGDWFYTHWKDAGTTSQTVNSDGTFSVTWQGGNYNFVGGPGWNNGNVNRKIGYNVSADGGASYITLYGWSRNPLVEYYILQRWTYDPSAGATQGTTFTSNGTTWTTYRSQRVNQPSIDGTKTFYQYWSKPSQQKALGQNHEIIFADHVAAWAASGWNLGNLNDLGPTPGTSDPTYQVMAVEVFNPASSGTGAGKVWDATGPAAVCGDATCNGTETCSSCASDCGVCSSTQAYLEAECATSKTGAYANSLTTQSGFSGTGHVTSSNNFAGTTYDGTSADSATFNFNVGAGTYKIYFRVETNASADDDSWFYQVNGATWTMENSHNSVSGWQWVAGAGGNVTLAAGNHTLKVANRENGLDMDKIAVLPSTAAAPTGTGSAATNCGASSPVCGDATCGAGESCSSCAADCGSCPVASACDLPAIGATGQAAPSGVAGNLQVLNWAGHSSAISYSWDDSNSSQISNYTALNALGVPLTFYMQTGKTEASNAIWDQAVVDGHEIGNHTTNHPSTEPSAATAASIMDGATTFIESNLGVTPYTFAAPNGNAVYQSPASTRFLINRGVTNGTILPNDSTNAFNLPSFIPPANATAANFNSETDAAKNAAGWKVFTLHGISGGTDGAYNAFSLANYQSAVNYAKGIGSTTASTQSQRKMWIDTVAKIGAYWRGQKTFSSVTPSTSGSNTTWSWSLPQNFPPGQCLRVKVDGGTLSQGGSALPWDGHGYYEISLDAGALTLSGTPAAPACGDATCNGTETCSTCSSDCGACAPACGDATCNGTETCSTCSSDCGACAPACGDATCNGTETCSTCSSDCGACSSSGAAIPGRIEAENYNAYNEIGATNEGGACNLGDGVDKSATTEGCVVGWTAAGEWLEYNINAGVGGTFNIMARVSSGTAGANFHINLDGVNITGTKSNPNNGWSTYSNIGVTGVAISAGAHTLRMVFDSAYTNFDWIDVTAVAACVPATSCSAGSECGTQANGCGGTIACGTCSGGETCNTGSNMCEAPPPTSSCTCPTGCSSLVNASVPLTVDAASAGTCYFFTGSAGNYINTWNTTQVNINGTNITNVYTGAAQ